MDIKAKEIKVVPINSVKFYSRNRNKHTAEQIDRLCKLIDYQGMRVPLVVDSETNEVIAGNGRLEAMKKMKWKEVPVIFQSFESEEQRYAFSVSDNGVASWAELDFSGINLDIGDFGPDFDLDLLGIKDFKIDVSEKEALCDEDEVPEKVEPKTKLGDLYLLGEHRMLCGDSTNIQHVERLMNGQKADMVFTDPPYGYNYESNYQKKHSVLINDDKILDFLPCAYSAMSDNSAIYVCGSHQTIDKWKPLIETNFKYKNLIVWKKNNWSMGDLTGAFAGQHELIFFAHKGNPKLRGERSRDVWEFDRDPPKDHPTQKPILLVEFAIEKVSDINNIVLDLFGGSGSTLIACEKTNRKCFMMELDPHYCDVIVARWEKYTGQKALLESGIYDLS